MKKSYFSYWGKAALQNNETDSFTYHPLVYHSLDVAAVGWQLLDSAKPHCRQLSKRIEIAPEIVRFFIVFSLLLHDIGKFSKTFQALVTGLFKQLFPDTKPKKYSLRHDTLGFLVWRDECFDELSVTNKSLAQLLGYFIKSSFGHHGLPPKEHDQGAVQGLFADSFFERDDVSATTTFLQDCFTFMVEPPGLPEQPKLFKHTLKEMSWIIAGYAVVSDWIGSNTDFFPYNEKYMALSEYWRLHALPRATNALEVVGWNPCNAEIIPDKKIISFLFPFVQNPTPLQCLVSDIRLFQGPKLFIIEDLTGAGKTEAALTLATRIMGTGEAVGLYIGLPTMATANSMYKRMQDSYKKMYVSEESPSIILSHGMMHLSQEFQKALAAHRQRVDRTYGVEETASVYCNEWYADNRKKSLLADVGIGTIDQALLAVLPARHQSLRLLGLQRKILIVDEVHACDTYMEHLLEVLLEAHARGGGSAILLSATIPQKMRNNLVDAFRSGLFRENEETATIESKSAFPLVTQIGAAGTETFPIDTRPEVCRHVGVSFFHDYQDAIRFIEEKSSEGQSICWIRNTVRDARATFHRLFERGHIPLESMTLFHSRFAMIDRNRIETRVNNNFGKSSGQVDREGQVVIATQVVEQSLDLDFDWMITDIAPIDLIIQRAGRLHRHIRDRNGNLIKKEGSMDERPDPIVQIFAPHFDNKAGSTWLSEDFKGSAAVYRNHGILWLTQKVLREKGGWAMPEDSRELIEAVYAEGVVYEVPDGLLQNVIDAEGKEHSKKDMGRLYALDFGKGYCRNAVGIEEWDEDENIRTRLTEESKEIVLTVPEKGRLVPYADKVTNPWDWSTLSISKRAWENLDYSIPAEYKKEMERLKKEQYRLKFSEIVVVDMQASDALASDSFVSELYDPRLGWGGSISEEENR